MRLRIQPASSTVNFLCRLSFITALGVHGSGQATQLPPQAQVSGPPAQDHATGETHFPVAVQHSGSWCYGYLHVSVDKVRLEVVQPKSDSSLYFVVPRAEVVVHPWMILGVAQEAIELNAKGVIYHMRLLADEHEVKTGAPRRWAPPISLPPDALIAAVQNPSATVVRNVNLGAKPAIGDNALRSPASESNGVGAAVTNPALETATATKNDELQPVPAGMLAGVYVATAGLDARPTNTQYLFYPDGFVMNGIPQGGMLNFDFNHCRKEDNPDKFTQVGRYRVDGEDITIVWLDQYADPANPDVIRHNETSAHPAVRIGPQVFIPMCRCSGKRLSGIYRWGAPAQDQYIQFFPDGTFLDHRATDQMILPSKSYEHPRILRGTYEIRQQTMIFTFADGNRGTMTFLAPKVQENNPTFDWIDFGWHMFFEEGYRAKLSQGW